MMVNPYTENSGASTETKNFRKPKILTGESFLLSFIDQ